MDLARVQSLLRNFSTKRILVIGDLMLDEFVWGRVSRISPEAPVPVVEVVRESSYPGGAANVARNARAFTSAVEVMGLLGADAAGEKLRSLLAQTGIGLALLQTEADFQTIVKTRIIARQQQVVRVDRERPRPISAETREHCLKQIEDWLPLLDGIIIEDYGKGFLQQSFIDAISALARAGGKIVTADPNAGNMLHWTGMTAIKPNRREAFAAANEPWQEPAPDPLKDTALQNVGRKLMTKWSPEQLLITLGEQGMILFQRDEEPYHTPSRAREVFDLSGAGDTAIALYTLALVSGAKPVEAAEISNHASSVVVAKLGTATLSPAELIANFETDL